jgi:hypothetical protein
MVRLKGAGHYHSVATLEKCTQSLSNLASSLVEPRSTEAVIYEVQPMRIRKYLMVAVNFFEFN